MFTKQVIDSVKDKHPSEWLEMLREFEATKRSLHESKEHTTVKLKPSLHEVYEEIKGTTLVHDFKRSDIYQKGVKLQGKYILKIPSEEFKEMILTITNKISKLVKSLLQKSEFKEIHFIILVGGFSNSCFVLDKLKQTVGHIPIIRPEEAELAVVRGAVLFGWNPDKISSRKSRRTYGIKKFREFVEGVHPENLSVVNDLGKKYCSGLFDCLIKVDQSVEAGAIISRVYSPVYTKQSAMSISLFATIKENVTYVTEADVFHVGFVTVDMTDLTGGHDREVTVNLHLGETEFKLDVTDITTGNNVAATYDFLTQ